MEHPLHERLLAELVGTFLLVFVGTNAVLFAGTSPGAGGHLAVSLAFGLVVFAVVLVLAPVSGAQINPAVTVGFVFARGLSPRTGVLYVLAQTTGAILASLVAHLANPSEATLGATLPTIPVPLALGLEALATFALVYLILVLHRRPATSRLGAAAAIGSTIFVAALVVGPLTGASLNPARSIGPAIVSGQMAHLWIYIVGPMLGALCAVRACRLSRSSDCCMDASQAASHT